MAGNPSLWVAAWPCKTFCVWLYTTCVAGGKQRSLSSFLFVVQNPSEFQYYYEDRGPGDANRNWWISQGERLSGEDESPFVKGYKHRQGFLSSLTAWLGEATQFPIWYKIAWKKFERFSKLRQLSDWVRVKLCCVSGDALVPRCVLGVWSISCFNTYPGSGILKYRQILTTANIPGTFFIPII